MTLPAIKEMFIPDVDHVLFEADLAGADAQVVAWEAGDEALKHAFGNGLDVHPQNAKDIFSLPALHAASPKEIKATPRLNKLRQYAKVGVHATNYGAKEKTLAAALQITVPEAALFQRTWFSKHPAIAAWQNRVENDLQSTRTVTNAFGYRRRYFDRVADILPQALAWSPQSTVAIAINKGWVQLAKAEPRCEILLQVHDSIVGQFHKKYLCQEFLTHISQTMSVPIPFDDPLTIQIGLKVSDRSWGHMEQYKGD